MFWKSVIAGFGVLQSPAIWVGIILYALATLSFFLTVGTLGKLIERHQTRGQMAPGIGCLFSLLGSLLAPLFQGALMAVFTAFLMPVMLGGEGATPVSVVAEWLWPIIGAGLIAVVAVIALCFLPLVGHFVARSPGVQAFIEGVIILRLFWGTEIEKLSLRISPSVSVYPGFWASMGYLMIAGVLVHILQYFVAYVLSTSKDTVLRDYSELVIMTVAPTLGILGGVLPLFMYVQHVRLVLLGS